MIRLERMAWGKRFLAKPSRGDREAVAMVRPRMRLDQQPTAPIAQKLVLAVAQGAVPFERLVSEISVELYNEEIKNGAGVLDIGLLGSRLFHGDVIRELHAGDGIFWDIEKPEND